MSTLNHSYRTHTCGALTLKDQESSVKLSGWVHRQRDHGDLLFIDLRDHYGITQCVFEQGSPAFTQAESLRNESVISVEGKVVARDAAAINKNIPTGEVEVHVDQLHMESEAAPLPLQVNGDGDFPEETRLRYRFLDLRREHVHQNVILRSQVIWALRQQMHAAGFMEIQTPILTASSPEGARDYLVPSRLHPGRFYALPQAPQMFKQLLMVGGFDKYFQIAPCFRDEDARADRSPGEFYQLDFEMSYVTQEDVFATIEPVLHTVFKQFSKGRPVSDYPFKRITYAEAMEKYGTDKPDLRNPLELTKVTEIFKGSGFSLFENAIAKGFEVRALSAPQAASRPRSFFDKLNAWAREEGAGGLGYVILNEDGTGAGPISKFLTDERLSTLMRQAGANPGDAIFFICAEAKEAARFGALARDKVAHDLDICEQAAFRFCWIVDYPMYEYDDKLKKLDFFHNPFSMPQGGLAALETQDPLDIKAYQYDIVCNGIELCSGAIRNHRPDIMYKACEIVGYGVEEVERSFPGLLNAFKYGAPPHGGAAPGVDRMVMLLADEPNIREVVAFPLTQRAEDLMMGAPGEVTKAHLKELFIKLDLPPKKATVAKAAGEAQ